MKGSFYVLQFLQLFALYTIPLSHLIHSHKLNHNLYANDTQIYISSSTADTYISLTLLKSLNWLPVHSRIISELYTIVYQTVSSGEPSYLFAILSLPSEPRQLRSSCFHLLSVPSVKAQVGTRVFFRCCPYCLEFISWIW